MRGLQKIKHVVLTVTPLEAAVIAKLREFEYGELTIKKKEGKPYQIVKGGTEILEARVGLNLKGVMAIPGGMDVEDMTIGDILSKLSDSEYGGRGEKGPAYGNEK